MLIHVLAFLGGILTIVSPSILPILPFVFSRADQPFRRSGLPLLAGMAITFAAVAGVATVAGAWIGRANQIGRMLALTIFLVMGLALVFPRIAEYLSRPSVRLGARVQQNADSSPSVGQSFLVLGPGKGNKPVRFRVWLDGAAPADDGGVDVDSQGIGNVKEYRLYQLIRQKGKIEDRTFQIEFLDPGVQSFAFTLG